MFEEDTARRLADAFVRFAELAGGSPDSPVALLPLVSGDEAGQLMRATAGAEPDAGAGTGVLAALEATVRSTPESTALVADGRP